MITWTRRRRRPRARTLTPNVLFILAALGALAVLRGAFEAVFVGA